MSLTEFSDDVRINPLDMVEQLASGNDWSFERASENEITILVAGRWTDYQVSYTWMDGIEALHLACAFDLRVPERRRADVQHLISMINEQMWIGHFDVWSEDSSPMFRHGMLLSGGATLAIEQVEDLIDIAISECERYYPAFQYVIWSGKKPDEESKRVSDRPSASFLSSYI